MVGGTKRPPQDSESGPWSHEQSNTKSNSNTKTFHEEESQNLSRVHVSLDNADTVIEGGPSLRISIYFEGCPVQAWLGRGFSLVAPKVVSIEIPLGALDPVHPKSTSPP